MKESVSCIWKVSKREFDRMTSRSIYTVVILILPVFSFLFFASLLKVGLPTKMPIAIVDLDHTATSRKMCRSIDATPLSRVIEYPASEMEAMAELRKGNIFGFIVLPHNLQADIQASRQAVVSYYYHNGFLTAGGLTQSNLTLILRSLSASISIKKYEAMGKSQNYILQQVQPVQRSTHLLFNPTITYSIYLSPIIMPIMLQIFILLMTVYSIGIEIKESTSHDWLKLSDKSIIIALIGKLLPYTLVFFVVMMFQNFILYKVMNVYLNSSIATVMLASFMFVLAYQAIGILFIGLFPLMRHSLNVAAFYSILALSLCGFTFPVESMLPVVQYWANLLPVRHYMHIFQSQMLAGFEWMYSLPSFFYLSIFLLMPFIIIIRLKSALIYQRFKDEEESDDEDLLCRAMPERITN